MLELTVGHSGEDYYTIQEAIDAVSYETEGKIIIKEGVYEEKLFADKRKLTIAGEGRVVIRWSDSARTIMPDGFKRGTFRSYTAFFSGHELHLENIRFENNAGCGSEAGQALALYLDVQKAFLENVELYGHQDTLFLAPLPEKEREKRGFYGPRCFSPRTLNRVYVRGGCIHGGVDFIFGGADALFENVRIVSNEEGYVAAPSGHADEIGFIFRDCSFEHENLEDESVYLMRPWRPEGKASFIDCTFSSHINRKGFCPWKGREEEASLASFRVNCGFFPAEYMMEKDEPELLVRRFMSMIG